MQLQVSGLSQVSTVTVALYYQTRTNGTDQDPRNSFGFLRLRERAHTPTIAAASGGVLSGLYLLRLVVSAAFILLSIVYPMPGSSAQSRRLRQSWVGEHHKWRHRSSGASHPTQRQRAAILHQRGHPPHPAHTSPSLRSIMHVCVMYVVRHATRSQKVSRTAVSG